MTDAILLQEIVKNKEIVKNNYKIIIIDEAHERTITSEIILSLVKE
jgi:HrpA-like RNA helicase